MTSNATAADTAKLNFYNAIKAQFAADPTKSAVMVTYGHPGTDEPEDIVSFLGVRATQQFGPMSSTNRAREEALTLDVTISCWRGGGQEMEQVVGARAYELLRALEYYVRQTDTTLGGAVRYCFLVDHQTTGETDPQVLELGRVIEITAQFGAVARITGT